MVYFIDLTKQDQVNQEFEEEASQQVSRSLDNVVKGDIPKIEFPEAELKYLGVLAKKFNSSNSVDIPEELQRLKQISDYFACREVYDRYTGTNLTYLNTMFKRLLGIQGETLPQHMSDLCSKLLKRFENGIVEGSSI